MSTCDFCSMLVRKLLLPTTLRNTGVGCEAREWVRVLARMQVHGCVCLRVCRYTQLPIDRLPITGWGCVRPSCGRVYVDALAGADAHEKT
jgi:hypothetical protein